ncbi:MAG TPA: pseudouridine synthase [Hungateiclostridium thermocellum]|uniref:Pseudouridine synthase n=2 Tax=Acetivibrio thermocellus TaxID=1515 RepID=A3DK77_ACET2|nr:16S rRNA pseudouridine(516) synthase [Acetivibrio thermocellus]CDG37644.1 putative RNA pseudouridine synthase YtzG [Acetivibrio thermocellus BC1]ABN54356.1 pseudouridine synthase [Acetivibrio thermocellus ATCC 27405]ADU73790.1 pseudouridine synthase [Acetivibrio thermocellus DSM 1313]ALX07723.1 pseudouridine synthase Rsu [Acetivibrio thermocellus AD2]ANV75465.1 pseudouridine synthase Rsu [Acetivibrio thermocellus DSM 2360]
MRDTQRIDKILSNSGFGTRKEIKKLIKNGEVKVDGVVVKDSAMQVNPKESVIEVAGEILKYREYIYIMMNKPQGVISATYDNRHRTVIDILPDEYKFFNLFPVGRLDIDTEGLLLLTNDGQLAHELLSPRKHVPKKYYALIDGIVTTKDVDVFREGVVLDDGYKTLPSELFILKSGPYSEVEIVIYEGKFHQVKRMFEAVGKKVKYLRRIGMGKLKLDETLEPGDVRELTDEEMLLVKEVEKVN